MPIAIPITANPGKLIYVRTDKKKFKKKNLKLTPKIMVGLVNPTNKGSVETLPVCEVITLPII